MALQFVIGRSGSGKTDRMISDMKKQVLNDPAGRPIIYIVPEQMSFLSEYRLAADDELGGTIRAQVYSFTRLAWRVLQEEGGMSRQHITPAGRSILIRKIIEENREELSVFAKAADKTGFVSTVEGMLSEFRQYLITPDEMEKYRRSVPSALADKLRDLQKIYTEFNQALVGKYTDTEDYMRLLAQMAAKSDYIRESDIYIDGFHSFTPQEYDVIHVLMNTARNVTIALTTDRSFRDQDPDDTHLFRLTGRTYHDLYEMAVESGVDVKEDTVMYGHMRQKKESLIHLESQFDRRPASKDKKSHGLTLLQAAGRRAEIEGAAREIRRLARTENYRYKQIALLVRNGEEYRSIIETVFDDYNIPFFIDQKRPMLNHPLIELIRSSLEVISGNWRYEAIFRAVKTDLLFSFDEPRENMRRRMDLLENYVLAHGIYGDRWTNGERWTYRRYMGLEFTTVAQTDEERAFENQLNEMKEEIAAPLYRLQKRLKRAKQALECCRALYQFIEELKIPEKMEQLSFEAEARGELTASAQHNQAWDAVIGMLDEFVEVAGGERMDAKKFAAVLDAGLEELEFSIVPPAADQVIVANPEKSRLAGIESAFVIGMNDGVFPARQMEDGILDDEERDVLISAGMNVAPGSKTRLMDEEFVTYRTLTIPASRLYVSWPIADSEGKSLQPSPYIKRLKEFFENLEEQLLANDPADLQADEQLEYICHPDPTLSYLTSQFQLKKRGYPLHSFWWDAYNFYMQSPQKRMAGLVFDSLYYENKTDTLNEKTGIDLYGTDMIASVSRMETFHSCAFSHFARHGLKLRDRLVYRLEAPDIGDLFHGALKWIAEEVERRGMKWPDLTKEQCRSFAKSAVEELGPKLQNRILMSSNRYSYIQHKLEQIIARASSVLSDQAKVSGFSPVGLELAFGPRSELPPLVFNLKNGARMSLAGRIDRVDKAEGSNDTYLRVIDYKSGSRDVDMTEVYYGFAMQMLTYLDIVLTHSPLLTGTEARPGGVLYFHVHNPYLNTKKFMTVEEIENEVMKSFRMKGLILGEDEAIHLMDEQLESGDSLIIPAGFKKDGTLSARSKTADEDSFGMLRRHVRRLYETAGNDIVSGNVGITPYRYNKKTPCTFCSYRQVCQFDESLDENSFRLIRPRKNEEIIQMMKEEEDDGTV
ncbi:helicase-exonuclease AddAB subunit AddB [Domibacillus epiphyticus]|uniref:ATP-dependent helicase/deoxyribonuclease subunit B n=1 Tax=Domibacillus epiphyticus TaxID=1714355 RepID=A0A1V2A7Y8_9BACI|nr:helicase-exonuclease AddAB subunit AddB [Domibacillus epiphyticus]OMP67113.1 helicase-exonuclease AddAB subunit AddB [Domibacillus epiphyticus]